MKTRAATLVLVAVAGCGEYNFTPIPTCTGSQVLTGDGKNLKCVEPGSTNNNGNDAGNQPTPDMAGQNNQLHVPACGDGRCLTGENDGTLMCVDITTTNQTLIQLINDVTTLKNQVNSLQKEVDMISGGGGVASWVGNSTATTVGRIVHANADVGLASAAATCADDFGAGAHMCTVYEMYGSVANGKITSKTTVPKAWVYFPSWQSPIASPQNPLGGNSDNCSSYTYPTNDRHWAGIAVEWRMNFQGDASGFWWHGGTEALCNGALPIACCK
jgi:hypothetical protein